MIYFSYENYRIMFTFQFSIMPKWNVDMYGNIFTFYRFRFSSEMNFYVAVNWYDSSPKEFVINFPKESSNKKEKWVVKRLIGHKHNISLFVRYEIGSIQFSWVYIFFYYNLRFILFLKYEKKFEKMEKKLKAYALRRIFFFAKLEPQKKTPLQRQSLSQKRVKLSFSRWF